MIPASLGADEMRPLTSATILAEAMFWGNCATAERATGGYATGKYATGNYAIGVGGDCVTAGLCDRRLLRSAQL